MKLLILSLLLIIPIAFAGQSTEPTCGYFCNIPRDKVCARKGEAYEITTGVQLEPLNDGNTLVGVWEKENAKDGRYLGEEEGGETGWNICIPDLFPGDCKKACGVAGRIHKGCKSGCGSKGKHSYYSKESRLKDDHDMLLTFVDDNSATKVTFTLIDAEDWNPGKYVKTRWTLTAYDSLGNEVDKVSVDFDFTNSHGNPIKHIDGKDACDDNEAGFSTLTVTSPTGNIVRVESTFKRKKKYSTWEPNSADPNMAVASICWEHPRPIPPCSEENLYTPSPYCSSHGYCKFGDEPATAHLFGCSCFSGYEGEFCETELDGREYCADPVNPTESLFNTSIDISFLNNEFVIDITAPVEVHPDTLLESNYATYTLAYFKNEDHCDYPEGDHTIWEKEFDFDLQGSECTETYHGRTNFSNLIGCTGKDKVCYQVNEAGEFQRLHKCWAKKCKKPPCYQCYEGQVQVVRGYRRTSENEVLSDWAIAENCHIFQMCLPWIQEVSTDVQLTSIVPGLNHTMIVTEVSFACFQNERYCGKGKEWWIIQIRSAVNYPWYIRHESTGPASAALERQTDGTKFHNIDFYWPFTGGITEVSGCDMEGEYCIQNITFRAKNCEALEEAAIYDLVGMVLDCYDSANCTAAYAALDPEDFAVNGQVTLHGGECEPAINTEFQTVNMKMETYLDDDFLIPNKLFIPEDLPTVYFRITADANIAISDLHLLDVTRYPSVFPFSYTEIACPGNPPNEVCFNSSVADLQSTITLPSNINTLFPVSFHATVEIVFDTYKRQVGTVGLNSNQGVETSIRVYADDDVLTDTVATDGVGAETTVNSSVTFATSLLVAFLMLFIF